LLSKKNRTFLSVFFILLAGITLLAGQKPRVLVFTKTAGWDHGTRAASDSVIRNLGIKNGFDVDTTSQPNSFFTDTALARYAALCFVNTTGTLFTDPQREALKRYIHNGGGYVGVHASTDCEYDWAWYGQMTGANFNGHPFNIATAKIAVLDKKHPSTTCITADTLTRTDEWYFWGQNPGFKNNPIINPAGNDSIKVLLNLVESSIAGSSLNSFHPMCWYQNFEGGRVWYLGFGHEPKTFYDTLVQQMLLGGIRYAAGMTTTNTLINRGAFQYITPLAKMNTPAVFDLLGRKMHPVWLLSRQSTSGSARNRGDKNGDEYYAGFFIVTTKAGAQATLKTITEPHD
jgi:type 1 glutamine amidotransferase